MSQPYNALGRYLRWCIRNNRAEDCIIGYSTHFTEFPILNSSTAIQNILWRLWYLIARRLILENENKAKFNNNNNTDSDTTDTTDITDTTDTTNTATNNTTNNTTINTTANTNTTK